MTIVGKILVIANLVFSLITGWLIITVFATRTNWKDGYEKARALYTVAQANAIASASDAEKARASGDEKAKALQKDLADARRERDLAKQELSDKSTQFTAVDTRNRAGSANLDASTAELQRRAFEIENLKAVQQQKDEKMINLETQNRQFRDDAIAAEIAAKAEHDRNIALVAQLEQMTKELDRRHVSGSVAGVTSPNHRPPADDVEGTVVDVDAKNNLVTISLGSDAGLTKGTTLEVYRLKPRPEYVGTISILDARFHEAVARPIMPLRAGPIQKGDTVASRINTTRR
jgi:hypothetical protein